MSKPREIKTVLREVLPGLRPRRGEMMERLQAAWKEVTAGEEAKQSRVKQLKKGILFIEVDSPAMMHHICGAGKEHLLKGLREKAEGTYIREIRTRLARD
ncbi:MAG: DUF721 domain-containing protein [Candidatus Brocadiales bacterium]